MRPFGNDITNSANNGNPNANAGNSANNGNNNNNNNNNDGLGINNNADPTGNNDDVEGNGIHGPESGSNDNNSIDSNHPIVGPNGIIPVEIDSRIPPHIARIGGIVTFSPVAGNGVIRVVRRCDDAKENNMLDLSECELMTIPDAVYHLMRNTELKTCNLSGNVLKKIAPKFAIKFNLITDLNLSHNQISRLPDELADLPALSHLNISHNSFIVLPNVVFKMPKLRELDAKNNAILEIDTDETIRSDCLEVVDLRNNPLRKPCRRQLKNFKSNFRIEISEEQDSDDDFW